MPWRLLPLAFAVAGCGAAVATVDLPLSWRFADGRRCADSGAVSISVTVDGKTAGPMSGFACPDGEMGRLVTLGGLPTDARTIALAARTFSSDVLYRGDAAPSLPLPSPMVITLYFTGGR